MKIKQKRNNQQTFGMALKKPSPEFKQLMTKIYKNKVEKAQEFVDTFKRVEIEQQDFVVYDIEPFIFGGEFKPCPAFNLIDRRSGNILDTFICVSKQKNLDIYKTILTKVSNEAKKTNERFNEVFLGKIPPKPLTDEEKVAGLINEL